MWYTRKFVLSCSAGVYMAANANFCENKRWVKKYYNGYNLCN